MTATRCCWPRPPRPRWSSRPSCSTAGVQVVDLSGAFRLPDASVYPRYYGFDAPGRRPARRGGLRPARAVRPRRASPGARWSPTPAATPTAAALAARSAAPGAGSSPTSPSSSTPPRAASGAGPQGHRGRTASCEVADDFRAYKVLKHQHTPEIAQTLARGAGAAVRSPSPRTCCRCKRGILCHRRGAASLRRAAERSTRRCATPMRDEPFVQVLRRPERGHLKPAVGTQRRVPSSARVRFDRAASWSSPPSTTCSRAPPSQAVQNLNLMLGLAERTASSRPGVSIRERRPGFPASPASTRASSRAARTWRWSSATRPCAAAGCFTVNKAQGGARCSDAERRLPADGRARGAHQQRQRQRAHRRRRASRTCASVPARARRRRSASPARRADRLHRRHRRAAAGARRSLDALPQLVRRARRRRREPAAEAILTTDTRMKMALAHARSSDGKRGDPLGHLQGLGDDRPAARHDDRRRRHRRGHPAADAAPAR